ILLTINRLLDNCGRWRAARKSWRCSTKAPIPTKRRSIVFSSRSRTRCGARSLRWRSGSTVTARIGRSNSTCSPPCWRTRQNRGGASRARPVAEARSAARFDGSQTVGRRFAMRYQDTSERLTQYRRQISDLRGKIRELQQSAEPQAVTDYTFATPDGPVRLSQLFGDKASLFVIHNMGAGCPYCTLWADGFNGLLPHIENRAAFVVASPDDPQAQEKFK